MKYLLLIAIGLIFVLSSCNSTDTTINPTAPKNKLGVTVLEGDSIGVAQGDSYTLTCRVTLDGVLAQGALVTMYRPSDKQYFPMPPTDSNGISQFSTSLPLSAPSSMFYYYISASKAGAKPSDTTRFPVIVDLSKLRLTIAEEDTQQIIAGAAFRLSATVSIAGTGQQSCTITLLNHLANSTTTFPLLTDSHGVSAINVGTNSSIAPGVYRMDMVASRPNFTHSDTVHRWVSVVGSGMQPSGLEVQALGSTSIGMRWVRGPDDHGSDRITATSTADLNVIQGTVDYPSSSFVLNGLEESAEYSITVTANWTVSSATARTVYATARRIPADGSTIRIYELSDTSTSALSGINLSTGGIDMHPGSVTAASADLVLTTDANSPPPYLSLTSASVTGLTGLANGRRTLLADTASLIPGGLDKQWFGGDFTNRIPMTGNTINTFAIPSGVQPSTILLVRTSDSHFARVEIVPQADGRLYGYQGVYRYIDVKLSFQMLTARGYAGRGEPVRGEEERRVAHR